MTTVYDLICRRRTIRRFKQDPIPQKLFQKLINAARLAPTGANRQPCEYILVVDSDIVEKVFGCLKWAAYIAPEGDPPEGERPTAYLVILIDTSRKKQGGEVDAAAAIMNIIITAEAEGLGSCWLGSIDRDSLSNMLIIPDHFVINSVIALGYPNENPVVVESDDDICYWKDEKGILHVPKRSVENVTHRNGYGK